MAIDPGDHRALVVWATACAEHVLDNFERSGTEDARPRAAIEAGRAWTRGELKMAEARKAAFAAHAAARNATDSSAKLAARAAGHAAATSHVHTHASHAANYAAKSAGNATPQSEGIKASDWAAFYERKWQREQLPERLLALAYPNEFKP